MNREFIPSMNPAASVTAWEVSPCLELPDYEGGSEIQAFETFEEAESASDEAAGPVFWGVYARLSETAIAAGELPALHIKDFDTHAKAVAFVRLMNGDEAAASARIVADEPELLEACKSMLSSSGLIGDRPDVLSAVQKMRRAIAKAEGRA